MFGVPDDEWGERVHAALHVRPGEPLDATEITAFCREHLAGYKAPRRVVFVAQVPRAPNGKADYRTAREQALASG